MRSIVHISKFVVNINLIFMFNPNIYLFSRAFYSAVAGGTFHFYVLGFFSVNDLAGVEIWHNNYGFRLGKPRPGQKCVYANSECPGRNKRSHMS